MAEGIRGEIRKDERIKKAVVEAMTRPRVELKNSKCNCRACNCYKIVPSPGLVCELCGVNIHGEPIKK
jgi:hypothetical protein